MSEIRWYQDKLKPEYREAAMAKTITSGGTASSKPVAGKPAVATKRVDATKFKKHWNISGEQGDLFDKKLELFMKSKNGKPSHEDVVDFVKRHVGQPNLELVWDAAARELLA